MSRLPGRGVTCLSILIAVGAFTGPATGADAAPRAPVAPPGARATTATTAEPTAPTAEPTPVTDSDLGLRDSEELRLAVDGLTATVTRLEAEAEVAVEDYNTTVAELQAAILAELRAQEQLDAARRDSGLRRADAERRVRALYRVGPGAQSPLAALRGGDDLGDADVALRTTRAMFARDGAHIEQAHRAVTQAVAASNALMSTREQRVAAQAAADRRSHDVVLALSRTRDLLARTDAALVAAVESERRQADELALAWALRDGDAPSPAVPAPEAVQAFLAEAAAGADPVAGRAITAAATRLGMPYTWGATGPSTFDCSGLVQWSYRQAGRSVPRTSRQQFAGLPPVSLADLQPGDLVFYANSTDAGSIHHVGMYVGAGLMIHAPRTGDVVKVSAIDAMVPFGAVRPVRAAA